MPLNDHHLDSINLLCNLAPREHVACARYAFGGAPERIEEQAAYAARLANEGVGGIRNDVAWGNFPHLHVPVAQQLRQRHFGDISKHLFGTYKRAVMSGAPASVDAEVATQ